jgi:hypothetical protein
LTRTAVDRPSDRGQIDQVVVRERRNELAPRGKAVLRSWKRVPVPFSIVLATMLVHIALARRLGRRRPAEPQAELPGQKIWTGNAPPGSEIERQSAARSPPRGEP